MGISGIPVKTCISVKACFGAGVPALPSARDQRGEDAMSVVPMAGDRLADPAGPERGSGSSKEPFRATFWQRMANVVRSLVAAQLVTLPAWGTYYVLLETQLPLGWLPSVVSFLPAAHHWLVNVQPLTTTGVWHAAVPNPFIRHGIRKTFEGMLIGITVLVLAVDPFEEPGHRRVRYRPWDRIEMFLRIPNAKVHARRAERGLRSLNAWQVIGAFLLWPWLYSLPLTVLLLRVADRLTHYSVDLPGPVWVQFLAEPVVGPVAYFVVGLIVSPLAKRPVAPVLAELQQWRAQAWAVRGRPIRWWHRVVFPPPYLEMVRRAKRHPHATEAAMRHRSRGVVVLMALGILGFLALFAVGAWVRFYVVG
jgi:hypothetical protein